MNFRKQIKKRFLDRSLAGIKRDLFSLAETRTEAFAGLRKKFEDYLATGKPAPRPGQHRPMTLRTSQHGKIEA